MTALELYRKLQPQWRPPPRLSVSEWADKYRVLPASSGSPGRWRNIRAPYLAEIMDAVKAPGVKEVWFMSSSQVGKSECMLNIVGYFIDSDPGSMLLVQPTVDMAESFSKERLASMLRDSPALRGKVAEPRESGSENTILHKAFHGGTLDLVGANSPAGLASRPKRIILADEVDRYDASAKNEGDPILLARKRSVTFWNRVFFACSTPTISGVSRIEKGFLAGDQRHYLVPCPHCNGEIEMVWEELDFSNRGTVDNPVYICPHCKEPITHNHKPRMLAKGRWQAKQPFNGIASFHINELYSPFSDWSKVVAQFYEAKKLGAHAIKVWKNTCLGLPYEETGTTFSADLIAARAESVSAELPEEALVLTAGIDVQGDRLEVEIVAWWDGDRSYSVDYLVIQGSPKERKVWDELDAVLQETYTTADGRQLTIPLAAIDSGDGNTSEHVMAYAMARQRVSKTSARGVIPIKGAKPFDAPVWSRPTIKKNGLPNPWMIGVSQIKTRIYDMLKVTDADEPGHMRFPEGRADKYYAGLTAEKLITRRDKRGFPVKEWYKIRERNEPLDCRVYAYAALKVLNPDYEAIRARPVERKTEKNPVKPQINRPRRPKMAIKIGL